MKLDRLDVWYAGWGEHWRLGQLADDGRHLLFEYSSEALQQGLQLSPLKLPLRAGAFTGFPVSQHRLPGLLADSLPDGWGLLLMDRWFRHEGLPSPAPLDRLAFVGTQAMGALRYAPARESTPPVWNLLTLAQQTHRLVAGEAAVALRELAAVGGSPQGARPKALVRYDAHTDTVSTDPSAAGVPWIVKFPGENESRDACRLEALYAELARECGLDMPATHYFPLEGGLAAFGAARFDREGEWRVPVLSLAALLDADFRMPGSVDYASFLRATDYLTRDVREVREAFARAVFNVVFHNRDDHPKNFAWRLGRDRRWRLAPAFDLTFSEGPGGEHSMDIAGKGKAITRTDLHKLAASAGITRADAEPMIDRCAILAGSLPGRLRAAGVAPAIAAQVAAAVGACVLALDE